MNNSQTFYIVGFGSQAKAWSLNLKDSGHQVHILLRPNSSSIEKVSKQGFEYSFIDSLPNPTGPATLLLLTPDETHGRILKQLDKWLIKDSRIVYAHGYSFIKESLKEKFPHLHHVLLAPKAIASEVRWRYETGDPLPGAYALDKQDQKLEEFVLSLARDIGINTGPFKTTFEEETRCDLFSEQSLLCSLLPYGALYSFDKLVKKGASKELAYLECWFELKLIADTMTKLGPLKFFELISPNALIGGEKARKKIFDKVYQEKLDSLLNDIWAGKFYQEIDNEPVDELRKKVSKFWQGQELTKLHDELGPKLFK